MCKHNRAVLISILYIFESMSEDWELLKIKEEMVDIISYRLHKKIDDFKQSTNRLQGCQ